MNRRHCLGEQDGPHHPGDHDKGAELPNGVSGHLLAEETVSALEVI